MAVMDTNDSAVRVRHPSPEERAARGKAARRSSGEAFERALASFAEAYADQNDRDFAALAAAASAGLAPAEHGV
jgi:hypothetical protein